MQPSTLSSDTALQDRSTFSDPVGLVVSFHGTSISVVTGAWVSMEKSAYMTAFDRPAMSDTASPNVASASATVTVGAVRNTSASPACITYVSEYTPVPRSTKVDDTLTLCTKQQVGRNGTRPASAHAAVTVTFTTSPTRSMPDAGDSVTDATDGTSRTATTAGPSAVHATLTLLYCALVTGLGAWPLVKVTATPYRVVALPVAKRTSYRD